jgi:hypothetical protein
LGREIALKLWVESFELKVIKHKLGFQTEGGNHEKEILSCPGFLVYGNNPFSKPFHRAR